MRAAFPQGISLKKAWLPAVLFAAANTALWIAWSGEWVQDILTGLSIGWFLCVLIACIVESETLSRTEWIGLGCAAVLVIAAQTMTFLVPAFAQVFDMIGSVILFSVDVWLILKTLSSIKKDGTTRRSLCLSFAAFVWSITGMYMSGGWFYYAAMLFVSFCYFLMLRAMGKEVTAT